MIVYHPERRQLVDSDTGDHLAVNVEDWELGEIFYSIRTHQDELLVGALVQRVANGDVGHGANHVCFDIKSVWTPGRHPHGPQYITGQHPELDRLKLFLRETLRMGGEKEHPATFEFVDERQE